jgi:hypothetical protein
VPDAAVALGLAAAVWLLYAPVLGLWWMQDDLFHLHVLRDHAPAWYLWDAAAWRQWPPRVLTPLLFLSLDADRALWGYQPHAFYVHQLIALSLVPAAFYAVLRLWLPRLWAAVGAFVFLIGPPVASLAPLLMVRHYIEATLLGTLSVGLWILALRRAGRRAGALAAASAAFWFLAAMAKEIAVPLVFFLPLIPEGTFRERLRRAAPHAVAFIAYCVVRLWFLGTPGGGYGFLVTAEEWPRLVLALPGKIAAEMQGLPTPAAWALLAAVLTGLAAAAALSRGAALRVGVALVLALAPVLPVSVHMEPRFAVAAWVTAAVALACAGAGWAGRGGAFRAAALGLALVAVAGGLAANRRDWAVRLADAERRSAEGRLFLTLKPGVLLRQPLGPPGPLGELRWWKEDVLGLPRGAGWFMDDLYLCLHPETGRVWGWRAAVRRIADLTQQVPILRRSFCDSIRRDAPLQTEVRALESGLAWRLGPYAEGRYSFVLDGGVTTLEMPRTGGFQLRRLGPLALRVKYEAPEGWVTYSPELRMDLARSPVFRWAR